MTVVATDLAALKAADVTGISMIYDRAIFTWTPGNYAGESDDINIIQSDDEPLTVGAWMRQSADTIACRVAAGAPVQTVGGKLREQVSVLDYIPESEHAAIKSETSTYDCTPAFQEALDVAWTVFVPNGRYLVGSTIREATNGGARNIVGQSRTRSKLVANPTLAASGQPILWLGNSNGHGNYRARVQHLHLDGGDSSGKGAAGAIGVRAHECGTSFFGDLYLIGCSIAIDAVGCIGSSFGGEKTEIYNSQRGLWHSVPAAGTPASPDDVTTTASTLSLKDNINHSGNFWFAAVAKPVRIRGGLTHLEHVVLQSCGVNSGDDLIHLLDANESYDYGGGPNITNVWCEGGNYRSVVRVENTRDARLRKFFLSGGGANCEQGIVVIGSKGCRVDDVAARGSWSRTASEGRAGNYWLYVDINSQNGIFGPFYFTPNTCNFSVDQSNANHNHIIIDNHRNNNAMNGMTVGNIQISGQYVRKNPNLGVAYNTYIDGFQYIDATTGFRINGTQVVGPRKAAITDHPSDVTVNSILNVLRSHGLIAI